MKRTIERYLVDDREERGARVGFIAAGRSGHADTAERHEAFLFDDSRSTPPAQPPHKTELTSALRKPRRTRVTRAQRRR